MICNISTNRGKKILDDMIRSYPDVPKGALINVTNYSNTNIKLNPKTQLPSSLLNELEELTQNETLAAQAAAGVYTDSFVNEFGDWLNNQSVGNKNLVLDEEGMPKLFYISPDGTACSSYVMAIGLGIKKYLTDKGLYNRYKQLVMDFYNTLQEYSDSQKPNLTIDVTIKLIDQISKFNELGAFRNIEPIQVGCLAITPNSKVYNNKYKYITEDYSFKKLLTLNNFNYSEFLSIFPNTKTVIKDKIRTYDDPRVDGYYRKLIDVEQGVVWIKSDLSIEHLKRGRSNLVKSIYTELEAKYPAYLKLYANNNLRFKGFIRGVAVGILSRQNNLDFQSIVRDAIEFETGLHRIGKSFVINSISGEAQQLSLFPNVETRFSSINTDRMENLLAMTDNINDVNSLLTTISSQDPYFADIAKSLIGRTNIPIEWSEDNWKVIDSLGNERMTDGIFKDGKIILSKKPYSYPSALIIHEVMHAVTSQYLHADPQVQSQAVNILSEAQSLLFEKYNVNSVDELAQKNKQLAYALSNIDEFFAMLWTNSNFIKELNSVGQKAKKSLWGRIKDFLLNILGIDEASEIYVKANTLLEEILNKGNYSQEELEEYRALLPDELYDIVPDYENEQNTSEPAPLIQYNKQQLKAIGDISKLITNSLQNNSRVICRIIGKAGTGKTTVVPEIVAQVYSTFGRPIKTCVSAVSHQAKGNLALKFPKSLKVDAKTIAALTGKKLSTDKNGYEVWIQDDISPDLEKYAKEIKLLVVDEASMLNNQIMSDLESLCSNANIIYVGDKRQIRPIEEQYNPITPFVTRSVDYSIELLERVRQGEGAPILDIADVYGDISGDLAPDENAAYEQLNKMFVQMNKEVNMSTDTNAVFSINSGTIENTVEMLMPIITEAIETSNPNKIGIVPFYNTGMTGARAKFNNLIRLKLLQARGIDATIDEKDPNKVHVENVPFQKGEILVLNAPYKGDIISLENGQHVIVQETGVEESSPLYTFTWRGQTKVSITVYSTKVFYFDSTGVKRSAIIRTIPRKSRLFYNEHLEQLRINAYQSGKTGFSKQEAVSEYARFKNLIANVSPSWALNVHKAQGQTYEIVYIPVDDFSTAWSETSKRGDTVANQVSQLSSQLYTAITRASNITILGKSNFFGTINQDLNELNKNIQKNKKSIRDIVKEELEDATVIEENVTPEVHPDHSDETVTIPPKFRKIYDFLKFVTGSNLAFKQLNTSEGKQYAQDLMQLFFQRESELVKFKRTFGKAKLVNGKYNFDELFRGNPELLYTPITKERLASLEQQYGPFQQIDNLEVKSAQAVLPAQYKDTFKFGSHSLSEINVDFFKHVNHHYWSKVENSDFLVRTHSNQFNIAFVPVMDEEHTKTYGKPIEVQKDKLGYRLDHEGNRMYWLPANAMIYKTVSEYGDENETIVIPNQGDINKITSFILKSISDDIVSVQPLLYNITDADVARNMIRTAEIYSVFNITEPKQVSRFSLIRSRKSNYSIDEIKRQLLDYYNNENIAKTYANKLSKTLYNSFVKSCSITSSRIPTQALASFMDMQVAAYNPEAANEVFVSRWQLWLQGSDLDIDKSYMMGHSFGKTGLFHHWSPISDYTSEIRRKISDELPVPNGLKIVLGDGEDDVETNDNVVQVTYNGSNSVLSDLLKTYIESKNGDEVFDAIKDILNDFNISKKFDVSPEFLNNSQLRSQLSNLIFILNKHNLHKVSENEAKNLAVDSIINVCQDVRNIQSAHSPIDAATGKLKRLLKDLEAGTIGDENDNILIFQLQEDNQTGKKVVGVMANALKAFLTITQYYNNYYYNNPNISTEDRQYFLNKIEIGGKRYYMSSVANTRLEENQLKVLKDSLLKYANVSQDILNTKDDVSIILSAMVTLATDNAKELALAKLHASLNLASMHTYLLTMGVPFDEVVKYTAKSKLFTDLYDLTKANTWEGQNGKLNNQTWKTLFERAKNFKAYDRQSGNGYTIQEVAQLKNLHDWAFEFRTLTQLLGINQGMDNGIAKAVSFKLQFESIISNKYTRLNLNNNSLESIVKNANPKKYGEDRTENYIALDTIIKSHGLEPTKALREFYINKIENFIAEYGNVILDAPIDMNLYYTDEKYRNKITDLYDILKSTINIFDVINQMPSFFAMLESLNSIVERTSKGAKGEFLFKQLPKLFNPSIISNVDGPVYITDQVVKDAQSFCDDYFISDFLVNTVQNEYAFTYELNPTADVWIQKEVTFDTQEGLKNFQESFKTLVARLKRNYANEFTKSLISYERKDGKTLYKLNFNIDALNKDQAGEQQLKYNQIVGGFSDLMNKKLSDIFQVYKGNPNMTVGDMFYLYNLIFNLGTRGQNTFTSLLDRYVTQSGNNSLVLKYLSTVLNFDQKLSQILTNRKKLNYHVFKRYAKKDSVIQVGESQMNPKDIILTNFANAQKHKVLQNTYQRFIQAYTSGKLQIDIDLNCN